MKVLQFSGGKDSLACLLLLKDQLHEITVLWCDSGDAFPETLAQMDLIKTICPNFVVVKGRQPEQIALNGYPVDVLPVRNHPKMQIVTGQERVNLQGFIECCNSSFWKPMHDATIALGATTIIRGQKLCDEDKSSVRNGDVVDGITYLFPVEDWSDNDVLRFVEYNGMLPEHYYEFKTSLDCMHCTAYLANSEARMKYIAREHKDVSIELSKRFAIIRHETMRDLQNLPLGD